MAALPNYAMLNGGVGLVSEMLSKFQSIPVVFDDKMASDAVEGFSLVLRNFNGFRPKF